MDRDWHLAWLRAVKFDSCNNLRSSVHTVLVSMLCSVSVYN